jgi:hypothetical protein
MHTKSYPENQEIRNKLGDPCLGRRIVFKRILKKQDVMVQAEFR